MRQCPGLAATYAEGVAQSPLAKLYADIKWEAMFRKTGEMNQGPYDWSADVAGIELPTLLIHADADLMDPAHIVESYRLLGGGTRGCRHRRLQTTDHQRDHPRHYSLRPDA